MYHNTVPPGVTQLFSVQLALRLLLCCRLFWWPIALSTSAICHPLNKSKFFFFSKTIASQRQCHWFSDIGCCTASQGSNCFSLPFIVSNFNIFIKIYFNILIMWIFNTLIKKENRLYVIWKLFKNSWWC